MTSQLGGSGTRRTRCWLTRVPLRLPRSSIHQRPSANVTAAPEANPDKIRDQLVQQVTGMVRWRESIANMAAAGVTDFVELGGKVLGPMVKRIAPDANVTSVVTIEDIEALAKELS